MMYWYGNGMSGWGYALMTASTIVFWGLVILGVIALVRRGRAMGGGRFTTGDRPAPEELLAERFARGEIDEDEYQSKLETLRRHAHPSSTSPDQHP